MILLTGHLRVTSDCLACHRLCPHSGLQIPFNWDFCLLIFYNSYFAWLNCQLILGSEIVCSTLQCEKKGAPPKRILTGLVSAQPANASHVLEERWGRDTTLPEALVNQTGSLIYLCFWFPLCLWQTHSTFSCLTLPTLKRVCACSVMSSSVRPTRLLCPWHFSSQEYWSALPFPTPGELPDPGIKATSPKSPALAS